MWYFFVNLGKTYNKAFLGIFREDLNRFEHKIALYYAQDNLGVKEVSAHSKNPLKCPIICFALKKNLPQFQNQRYIKS